MEELTLIIPAKREAESLPSVLEELKKFNVKKKVILQEDDIDTIKSIQNFDCEIIYQTGKGYGNALKDGLNKVETKYFCIFNADGSFNPNELKNMVNLIEEPQLNKDIIFASRYEKNCSSEDDTLLTFIGNKIFTLLGRIFFNLEITDILYTFVLGKAEKCQKLNLESNNFCFCVELPIKAKRNKLNLGTSKSHERRRIGGKKKVNEFKDGFIIMIYLIKLFFLKK